MTQRCRNIVFGGVLLGVVGATTPTHADPSNRSMYVTFSRAVELPGVEPETVHVFADDRTLLIAGERCRPQVEGRYQLMEIEYGPFQRRLALPELVDAGAARATYSRGLLTIVLPIAAKPPRAEQVTIQVVMQR